MQLRIPLAIIIFISSRLSSVSAQTPTLEFATGQGNTTSSGPTIADQVITFQNNPDNPSGSTFAAYSPTTTVTYSLGNQIYGSGTTNPGVVFGGTTSASSTPDASVLFQPMGTTSALAQYYQSTNGVAGGIDVTNNYALQVLVNANYNNPVTANATYQYADLTLTFNRPMINPVLQVVGLGARSGTGTTAVGYTTDLTMLTSGVTLSLLTGSKELQVTSTKISNSATTFSTTTNSGAASGSVLVTTPNGGVTSLQLRLLLRIGANSGAPTQAGGAGGDGFLLGVSQRTPTPLPVTLVDFTAQPAGQAVALRWTTASELRNDYFAIERSLDGTSFQAIGQVRGRGTNGFGAQYSFLDAGFPAQGAGYYRLRQVDVDGVSTYSPVRVVPLAAITTVLPLSLSPNPATDLLVLDLTALSTSPWQVRLFDTRGREVLHQELAGGQAHRVSVAALPSGVYSVLVQQESQRRYLRLCKH